MGIRFVTLLDTHAWIWWASGSPHLSRKAARAAEAAEALGVSAISCREVAMLVAKRRLVLDRDVDVWLELALSLPRVQLLPLSPKIAARSTRLGGALTDPADCMIVATALEYGCPIVSKDDRVAGHAAVRTIW